jgi:mono/diheme cytochrome c family protein
MSDIRTTVALPLALTAVVISGCTESGVSYSAEIKPIFEQYCQECHVQGGDGYAASGFLVDSYEGVMKGTKYGEVIVPGSAITSSLYLLVAGKTDPSIHMPHGDNALSEEKVAAIEKWIDQGAAKN